MNISTIATYAGWGLLSLFVITIFVLVIVLLKDRDTTSEKAPKKTSDDKKELKANKKANKNFIKEKAAASGVSAKRAKKDLSIEESNGLLATDKVKQSAFAVEGVHTADEIVNNLGDLNGARTTNPFRDQADDTFTPVVPSMPGRPVATPPVRPVAPQQPAFNPAPAQPFTGGLPAAPPRPNGLPTPPPNSKVSGPPSVEGSLPPKLFANKDSRQQ